MQRMGVVALKVVSRDAAEPVSESAAMGPGARGSEASGAAALDDDQLVALTLAGDTGAFEQLYRRYAAFAFSLAVRLQGHSTDVEDVVHDAFLKAHAGLDSLRRGAAFRGWLGSIVVNLVRARIRQGRWLQNLRLAGNEPIDLDSIAAPNAGPEVRAQLAQVYNLLRMMPADERIAWTLRHVQCHRLEEVSAMTGCSLATVKRRLLRAQNFFEQHYRDAQHDREAQHYRDAQHDREAQHVEESGTKARRGNP